MNLFKNNVGRPSNETLKKRRIIYCTIAITVLILIVGCVFYVKNNFFGEVGGVSKNATSSCAQPYNISFCENEGYYGRPHGEAIKKLQEMLKEAGYHYGYVNGNYGSYTVDAVKRAQKAYGLSQTGQADYQLVQKLAPKYGYGYTIITYNRNGGNGTIYGTKDDKQFVMRANTPISSSTLSLTDKTHIGWTATSKSRYNSTTYYYGCSSTNCTKPTMYTATQKKALGSKFVPYVFTPSEKVHSDTFNAIDGVLVTFNAYYCNGTGAKYSKTTSACSGGKTSTTTLTATLNVNGANYISSSTVACSVATSKLSSGCTVKLPTITPKAGFTTVGWSTNKNATTTSITSGQSVTINKNTTYYAITKSSAKYIATFNKNFAKSIGATTKECYRYNGASSCNITAPTITPQTGYTAFGWGESENSINKVSDPGNVLSVTRNKTYYAITRTTSPYTVTFNYNGANSSSTTTKSCYVYNNDSSCKVTTPSVTPSSDRSFLGWSQLQDDTVGHVGANKTINLKTSKTYYAISKTKNKIKVVFWPRSAKLEKNWSIGTGIIVHNDYIYNTGKVVTAPKVILVNNKQSFQGWTTNQNAISSTIKEGSKVRITKAGDYYAIIKEKITVTFDKNKADSLSVYKLSCTSYGSGCKLSTAPTIYSKGNEIRGFVNSKSDNGNIGSVLSRVFTKDTTLYASISNSGRKTSKKYDIYLEKEINGKPIYFEKGIMYNDAMKYYNYLVEVSKKMPYLFIGKSPLNFVTRETMDSSFGNAQGIMYFMGPMTEYSNVDNSADAVYNEYAAASPVHELGHVADEYYATMTGKFIHDQADIVKLYNENVKKSSSTRPLRDYSYSDTGEFVADMFEYYYYYKYLTNVQNPKGGNKMSKEMVTVLEKYIKEFKKWY